MFALFKSRTDSWGLRQLANKQRSGGQDVDLLACERFAFPVGCGASFLGASGLTPNRIGGAGPVFCACKGIAVGCWGMGGTGGGDGE